jgi:hypothetical protein
MAVGVFVETDAPAKALALILSADGSVHERALGLLGDLGAFDLLRVSRERFIELARDCNCRIAPGLHERSWLSDEDITHTEALLDAVGQADDRILVCRLAAAAMEDDGLVTHGTRLVFDHALAHWRIDPSTLSPALRKGRAG